MVDAKGLLIFGFGGHARSVADVALACNVQSLCFVDENAREGEEFLGFPVVKQWTQGLPIGWKAFSASGNSHLRQKQCDAICRLGWPLATLVARSATIGVGAIIERGSFVAHQAHIGPMARIGVGCIINTCAVVEHECLVCDFSHVSINATIAGRSKIGAFSMLGAGATVIDGIEISERVTIGAGAVVNRSIFDSGTYVGIPARRLRTNKNRNS